MDQIFLLKLKTILEQNIQPHQRVTKEISICQHRKCIRKKITQMGLLKFHTAGRFIQVKEEFQFLVTVAEIDTPPITIYNKASIER